MSTQHSQFVIERRFAAPVARVFAAWADVAQKRRWTSCHDDWRSEEHQLDFRVGGSEHTRVVEPDGTVHVMRAHIFDIVPDQRIVYAYEMALDDVRISVSLVTVSFAEPRSKGMGRGGHSTMTFTEQVVFLDGHGDVEERRAGTEVGFGHLRRLVEGQ